MIKNKTAYVANGCMTFIDSLINQHHADELAVYENLLLLIQSKVTVIKASDPDRNK